MMISAQYGRALLTEIDRLNKQLVKPRRINHTKLRGRAIIAATGWAKPTHELEEREAIQRCVFMRLSGYESRRRDEKKK